MTTASQASPVLGRHQYGGAWYRADRPLLDVPMAHLDFFVMHLWLADDSLRVCLYGKCGLIGSGRPD